MAPRFQFSSVQLLSHVRARQGSLSITNSRSPPKLMSIESVMPSNHLILCHPLLLLPSIFRSIRVFSHESALCNPMDYSTLGSSDLHYLLEFSQIHHYELVMPSNHLILCCPFSSCLQSFPVPGSFLMNQFFASGVQSIGVAASASVLPMNVQD